MLLRESHERHETQGWSNQRYQFKNECVYIILFHKRQTFKCCEIRFDVLTKLPQFFFYALGMNIYIYNRNSALNTSKNLLPIINETENRLESFSKILIYGCILTPLSLKRSHMSRNSISVTSFECFPPFRFKAKHGIKSNVIWTESRKAIGSHEGLSACISWQF